MRTVVIASRNQGKIVEIREIFRNLPVEFRSLSDFSDAPEVVEDGTTFAENSRKKAREVARFTGLWALADDSGLEVDALEGRPGIHSARWAGGGDEENNDRLLRELQDVPMKKRGARYRAHIAIADPEGNILSESEGACEGRIGFERKGSGGFGYDPLFFVPEFNCMMAEVSSERKNRISHRGQALEILRTEMGSILNPGLSQDSSRY